MITEIKANALKILDALENTELGYEIKYRDGEKYITKFIYTDRAIELCAKSILRIIENMEYLVLNKRLMHDRGTTIALRFSHGFTDYEEALKFIHLQEDWYDWIIITTP